jgi:hypothetical protein
MKAYDEFKTEIENGTIKIIEGARFNWDFEMTVIDNSTSVSFMSYIPWFCPAFYDVYVSAINNNLTF